MIEDREKDQKATDAIIAKAIAANLWYMDSYREVERYWYEGVDVLTAKESTELTRSSTGQVPTQAVGAVSSSLTLGPALQDWPGASPKAVAAPALPLQNAEAEETINDAAPSSAQTLELGGGSQTLELGGDSPSEPHATQPDSPDVEAARLVEELVMCARALLPSLNEHGKYMQGFIDEISFLIDSSHQTDDLEEKESLRIELDVECHKAAAVRNLLAYWND